MMEQTGEEIDWDKCPPDAEDFPESVGTAINIYNNLGDHVYSDVGFIGKDFTMLELLFSSYGLVHRAEKDWALELLIFMQNLSIDNSQRQIKAAHDKAKR